MPELPEVETMRRGIAVIGGSRIDEVFVPPSTLCPITIEPSIAEFRRKTIGRIVAAVGRRGKRLVIELDSTERIVIEPRMTGRVLLGDPPDESHCRLVLGLSQADSSRWRVTFWDSRGLGVVRLMTAKQFAERLGPSKIGPDALEITADELRRRAGTSHRAVKVALMDQKILAGVGNLYASELLHRARIHPDAACSRLRHGDWNRIHAAMQATLREAIVLQGSTLGDGTYQTVQGEPGRFQEQHLVYQREGEVCRQCRKSTIVRIIQTQRSSFFCPKCQRRRRLIKQ